MLRLIVLIMLSYSLLGCSVENQEIVNIAPTLTPFASEKKPQESPLPSPSTTLSPTPKLLTSPTRMKPLTLTPTLIPSPTKTTHPSRTPSITPLPTEQASSASITLTPTLYTEEGSGFSLPNHGCLAFLAVYGEPNKRIVEPFLFNPTNWSLHSLQARSNFLGKRPLTWSPTEPHLAMIRDHSLGYNIWIWNIETFTETKIERTQLFGWSPNGKYIVTQQRHQWGFGGFDIRSGDGSEHILQARTSPGEGGGYSALGWEDNRLLANYYGGHKSFKGPRGLWLLEPATKEWTLLEELLPHEFSHRSPNSFQRYGSRNTSSDGVLRASFKDGQLLIEDLLFSERYFIKLPTKPVNVSNIIWSPALTCPIKKATIGNRRTEE